MFLKEPGIIFFDLFDFNAIIDEHVLYHELDGRVYKFVSMNQADFYDMAFDLQKKNGFPFLV